MRTTVGGASGPRIELIRETLHRLPQDALAAITYGSPRSAAPDPRIVHVGISTVDGIPAVELWRAAGGTVSGSESSIRFSADEDFLFGILELDESRFAGVSDAAEVAYRQIRDFQERHPQRHLLRIWNFLDSINEGDGDLERYRQFCLGRTLGLGDLPASSLPAATAVGRCSPSGHFQVCWLAGRRPGLAIENPRQVRAYEYPRQYGPRPPSFARAIRLESGQLIGSGTSSIVGHESRHEGDLMAQVDETLENLRELHRAGGGAGAPTGVKAYLRRGGAGVIADRISAGLPGAQRPLLVEADICRRELLIEIECVWT